MTAGTVRPLPHRPASSNTSREVGPGRRHRCTPAQPRSRREPFDAVVGPQQPRHVRGEFVVRGSGYFREGGVRPGQASGVDVCRYARDVESEVSVASLTYPKVKA